MHYLLLAIGLMAMLAGFLMAAASKTALHEIQAFILLLIAAVCASGAGIIHAVLALRKAVSDTPTRFIPGPGDRP